MVPVEGGDNAAGEWQLGLKNVATTPTHVRSRYASRIKYAWQKRPGRQLSRLARNVLQRALYCLGIIGDDLEVGAGWLVRFGAALLPVAQCAEGNAEPR